MSITKTEARDEFVSLRNDDEIFASQYNENEFQQWLDDYEIGLIDNNK